MQQKFMKNLKPLVSVSAVYIFAFIAVNMIAKYLPIDIMLYQFIIVGSWILTVIGILYSNLFAMRLSTLLILFIGAGSAAVYVVASMVKGIELVAGIQENQYGLINVEDATFAFVGFLLTVFAMYFISTCKIKRKEDR